MSIRSEVKESITHFVHDQDYVAERTKWRGLQRTYKAAVKALTTQPKKRKKTSGDTSSTTAETESEG